MASGREPFGIRAPHPIFPQKNSGSALRPLAALLLNMSVDIRFYSLTFRNCGEKY